MIININKKHIFIITCILLVLLIFIQLYTMLPDIITTAILKNDWGLAGYTEEKNQPSGNADKETLNKYNACYVGNEKEKVIYLTFDAGYENGYTSDILDVLKKNDVKATFFLVGHYINSSPDLVKRMVDEGHIVGNHSYSHPNMTTLSFDEFKTELTKFEDAYKQLIGRDLQKFYRPPEGKFNEENLSFANKLNYTTVFWSLAYNDWNKDNQPSHEAAFNSIIPKLHNGCVLLLHSTSKTNSEILDELIVRIKAEGYTFKDLNYLKENYK